MITTSDALNDAVDVAVEVPKIHTCEPTVSALELACVLFTLYFVAVFVVTTVLPVEPKFASVTVAPLMAVTVPSFTA